MVANTRAEETFRLFENSPGHYNNTLDSHFRGKIGELVCVQWAESSGFPCEPIFRDAHRMQETDLHWGGPHSQRIEVKTWNATFWQNLGRCIAVNQMPNIRAKADIVLWCITPDGIASGISVEIAGWNTVAEIAQLPSVLTGPKGGRQVHNHQIPIDQGRPLADLVNLLTDRGVIERATPSQWPSLPMAAWFARIHLQVLERRGVVKRLESDVKEEGIILRNGLFQKVKREVGNPISCVKGGGHSTSSGQHTFFHYDERCRFP